MAGRPQRTRRTRRDREADEALGILGLLLCVALWRVATGVDWRTLLVVSVAGITIALLAIRWLRQGQRRKARERLLLTEAVSLNPIDFERRVQMLLTDLGWERVEHVGGAGDGGVDLRGRFGGQRYIVQCKRYRGLVIPAHIRDLAGALGHEPAERALLVTTGHVSPKTRAWVVNKPIDIWDAELLAQHIRQAEDMQRTPEQIARSHRATRRFLGILAGVNVLTIILAISLPDSAISMSVARQASDAPGNSTIVALSPLLKSPTPIPQRIRHTPLPTSVATVAPQLSAIVINGGNLRMRPTLQGKVLDQVHAREMVTLLARTGDGAWYQVSDERAVVGYVHESLLNVDQQVAAQVPVVAP